MSFDVTITGANLNTDNLIKVVTPTDASQAGYTILAGELAEPTDPTGRIVSDIRTSAQGRLSVGSPIILLNEVFNGFAVNTSQWQQNLTTMAIAAGPTSININSAAITTTATTARFNTYAFFPFQSDLSTFAVWEALYTQAPQANAVTEMGFFQATAQVVPTDGAFFRFDATGTLKAVLNNNSQEQMVTISSIPSANVMHKYKVICENDRVLFYIDGSCVASILSAVDIGMPMNAQSQPFTIRHYIGTPVPSLGAIIKLAYICIGCQDAIGLGKSAGLIGAISGKMGSQGQSGMTMGSTANYTNSMALGAGAVLTNTTAAAGTGLGGQFTIQPTLAAGTDGILCSYLNPIPTTALPGKILYIYGVRIVGMVTAALTGGPGALVHSLAYGHNALSMATAEAAATKAPRRLALGLDYFAATAAVGATNQPIAITFGAPIAVNPGEYVAIVTKFLAGTIFSGTTGLITYFVTFDAAWE